MAYRQITVCYNERIVDAVTIGAAAQALFRSPEQVRRLERDRTLPQAPLIMGAGDPRGQHRLYVRQQVVELERIAVDIGLDANSRMTSWQRRELRNRSHALFEKFEEFLAGAPSPFVGPQRPWNEIVAECSERRAVDDEEVAVEYGRPLRRNA